MEDDLVCDYDSTWDTESDGDDFGEYTTRRSSQDKTKKTKTGFVCLSIFYVHVDTVFEIVTCGYCCRLQAMYA